MQFPLQPRLKSQASSGSLSSCVVCFQHQSRVTPQTGIQKLNTLPLRADLDLSSVSSVRPNTCTGNQTCSSG